MNDIPPKRKRAPGAGRKRLVPNGMTAVSVTLSAEDIAYLRDINPNLSAAIRSIVRDGRIIRKRLEDIGI